MAENGGELVLADRITAEVELRRSMVEPVLRALDRPGALVRMDNSEHVTIGALTEIAAHLAVSVEVSLPECQTDPITGEPAAVVTATATRADGVSAQANGVASLGERTKRTNRLRWTTWHGACSMAETRARVRALSALLSPAIQEATNGEVSLTPVEPSSANEPTGHDGHRGHRGGSDGEPSAKRQVFALVGGDVELARVLWERHGGDVDAIRAELDAEAHDQAEPVDGDVGDVGDYSPGEEPFD